MEYVGYQPNVVHFTVHTKAYNHMIGTQKGASKTIQHAETEFHIYAVEWTADYIKGFVDGVEYFQFNNDGAGNKETWPFNVPFYLKLNLAWGGNPVRLQSCSFTCRVILVVTRWPISCVAT